MLHQHKIRPKTGYSFQIVVVNKIAAIYIINYDVLRDSHTRSAFSGHLTQYILTINTYELCK